MTGGARDAKRTCSGLPGNISDFEYDANVALKLTDWFSPLETLSSPNSCARLPPRSNDLWSHFDPGSYSFSSLISGMMQEEKSRHQQDNRHTHWRQLHHSFLSPFYLILV